MGKADGYRRYMAMVSDVSLAEHDATYHPKGYKEGNYCKFRRAMGKDDKVDRGVAEARADKAFVAWEKECRRRLMRYSEEQISAAIRKFDDGEHSELLKLIDDELERRWKSYNSQRFMESLGESA